MRPDREKVFQRADLIDANLLGFPFGGRRPAGCFACSLTCPFVQLLGFRTSRLNQTKVWMVAGRKPPAREAFATGLLGVGSLFAQQAGGEAVSELSFTATWWPKQQQGVRQPIQPTE